MSFDEMSYKPQGDKKNSDFFEEYKLKVYQRRKQAGLEDLLGSIRALVMQVENGDALAYMEELYLMTPYRFTAGYINNTHKIYFLTNKEGHPCYILLEPLSANFVDNMTHRDSLYPNARKKANARYVGEVIQTKNMKETQTILESHDMRFHTPHETENNFFNNSHFAFTFPSYYTGNRIGYTESDLHHCDALNIGQRFLLSKADQAKLDVAEKRFTDKGLDQIVLGVDHMATRILSNEREDAILEFLSLSNYYFWGAYNIHEMNSSTNVTRNAHAKSELHSPAKVFTANNTPFMVNSFKKLPMPTEDFVRNYGRRMHHIAQHVKDGNHTSGQKNIDYAVSVLADDFKIPFLAHVVGECKDEPDLKQIFSEHSDYSLLITEYIERCNGYEGFFTRGNVAALTQAAGKDEALDTALHNSGRVFD